MRGLKYFFLIFVVTFGGVGFGILFGMILPEYRDARIAREGVPHVATVTDFSVGVYINDEPYYKIHFIWQDKDGSFASGETNSAYTEWDLRSMNIEAGDLFRIRVKDGHAVAEDFKMAEDLGFMWIFVIAFGGVGVGMGIAFFVMLFRDIRRSSILLRGQDGTGKFIGSTVGMYVNSSPRYKVTFSFQDSIGQEHIVKTGTIFMPHEADALKRMETFPIKFLGDKAAVKKDAIRYDLPQKNNEPLQPDGDMLDSKLDGYVNPEANSVPRVVPTYNQILREIERQKTYNDMLNVLEKYSNSLDSETYSRLQIDLDKIREKRKIY